MAYISRADKGTIQVIMDINQTKMRNIIFIILALGIASCVTIYRYDVKCDHIPNRITLYGDETVPPPIWERYIPKRNHIEPFYYGYDDRRIFPLQNVDIGMWLMWDTISVDTMGLRWTK